MLLLGQPRLLGATLVSGTLLAVIVSPEIEIN
jgi:hypothetical protein